MTYRITGLDPAPYRPLYGLSDADLAARGAVRLIADTKPGAPCRVSLTDAEPGCAMLLVNHVSHDNPGPYRAAHAIFVREDEEHVGDYVDIIPPVFAPRILSLRGFGADGMMVDALLTQPGEAKEGILRLFANPAIAIILRRDRAADGQFVTGVLTTGIYCRPSCAARHPARANVRFFATSAAARAVGLRACKRCLPDDVLRDESAVLAAIAAIKDSEEPLALADLARRTGYSPTHFQRVFARHTGLSPAAYARALRAERARAALGGAARVTDAIYDAGYSAPSRFYDEQTGRLGMTASAWKDGGRGVTMCWAVVPTSLGPMLVAATDKGVCRLAFGLTGDDLAAQFPNADLVAGDPAFAALLADVVAAVEAPAQPNAHIPLDVQGTAFQEAVWRALRTIPPGETRTYADIAAAIGKPAAVRAAGSANGANQVAVLIPCHRVVPKGGGVGGYAWGPAIKEELLRKEGAICPLL
jgi:AraC family transcriptional regulator, regulatory protein of adaptative response / methylated-DNA-[protein]-cysteine methyltransferase